MPYALCGCIQEEIILTFETHFSLGLNFSAMLDIGLYTYRKSPSDVLGFMLVWLSRPFILNALGEKHATNQ